MIFRLRKARGPVWTPRLGMPLFILRYLFKPIVFPPTIQVSHLSELNVEMVNSTISFKYTSKWNQWQTILSNHQSLNFVLLSKFGFWKILSHNTCLLDVCSWYWSVITKALTTWKLRRGNVGHFLLMSRGSFFPYQRYHSWIVNNFIVAELIL